MYETYPASWRRLMSTAFTAASVTISFQANAYKMIAVNLDINGGYINTVAMTGLTAGTYYYENITGSVATPGASGATSQNNWVPAGTTGVTSAKLDFNVFPAPAKKAVLFQSMSGGSLTVAGGGHSTDTTNDPTAIVITFDASRTGYVYAVGYT